MKNTRHTGKRPAWLTRLRRVRHANDGVWGKWQPLVQRELAHGIGTLMFAWTRIEVVNPEILRWCMTPGHGVLVLCWHNRTLVPLNFFRNQGAYALISHSRDGNLQGAIFRRFGWNVVRGSSDRDGVAALRQLVRVIKRGDTVGLTPDGPRGPREVVQLGAALIQRLARCPVVPVGVAFSRRLTLATWDRYQLPMPGSRAVLYFDQPTLPDTLVDLDIESTRRALEERLHSANEKAERIALHGHGDCPAPM